MKVPTSCVDAAQIGSSAHEAYLSDLVSILSVLSIKICIGVQVFLNDPAAFEWSPAA